MANLFYGVSTTGGSVETKSVIIYNPLDMALAPGDILAVYFTHGNTNTNPRLSISGASFSNGEDETLALISDPGESGATIGPIANLDYMWQSGEVCLFVLVTQQHNSDLVQGYTGPSQTAAGDTLYYMLIRGIRANSEYYGLTKLFTDNFGGETEEQENQNFYTWLNSEVTEDDRTLSATPYLIKKLSQFLVGNIDISSDPPETTDKPAIFYTPVSSEEGTTIGILTVGDTEYNIVTPIWNGIERTSQLINDADIRFNSESGKYFHNVTQNSVEYDYSEVQEGVEYIPETTYYTRNESTGAYNEYIINPIYTEIDNVIPGESVPSGEEWYTRETFHYEEVTSDEYPGQSPSQAELYVYIDNNYVRTSDETWVEGKVYYKSVEEIRWIPVEAGSTIEQNVDYYKKTYPDPYDVAQQEEIEIYTREGNGVPLIGNNFITDVTQWLHLYKKANESTGIYVVENVNSGEDARALVEEKLKKYSLLIRESNKTILNQGYVNDPLEIYGNSFSFKTTNDGLPIFTIGTTECNSSKKLKAPEFFENGVSLKNKYSPILTIKKLRIGKGHKGSAGAGHYSILEGSTWVKKAGANQCISVGKGETTGHQYVNIEIAGYKPLGIVGYNISYVTAVSGAGANYYESVGSRKLYGEPIDAAKQILWELYLTNISVSGSTGRATLAYDTLNLKNDVARFIIDVDILCAKII